MTRFSAIPSAAIDDARLTGADLNVLAALGYHTCKDGWCWPSQDTLATKARLTRQSVSECIKKLVRFGYVEKYVPENRDLSKIRYRVVLDVAAAPASETQPVETLVASPDKGMSPEPTRHVGSADKLVATADKACRVTRHKQEPTNHSKEQEPNLSEPFEEVWAAWSQRLRIGKAPHRGEGKAKTFEIFRRKAGKADPNLIRAAANAFIAKTEPKYLPGLSVWLNQERYDTGENVVAMRTALSAEDKLFALREYGRWDKDWGPRPQEREELFS